MSADQQHHHPAPEGYASWPEYWRKQGIPWRTEPEIDAGRRRFLTERRPLQPDIEKGFYPFRDEGVSLTRADVEWLLATQPNTQPLDLRGADLRGINLSGLPLRHLLGCLDYGLLTVASPEQRAMAQIHLEQANLRGAHLEEASLRDAHLERAVLTGAVLDDADLSVAHLEGADLQRASLRKVNFHGVTLQSAESSGQESYVATWRAQTSAGRY